jgi:CRISPR-associated protein (TIGR03986 family)
MVRPRDTQPDSRRGAMPAGGKDRFHNPYNFVPALVRQTSDPELGDHLPASHDQYLAGRWSGQISVTLTAATPLLLLDAAKASTSKDHKTYPLRLGLDGKPNLPATSIKGMLRSAYEAITNSRLSIFEGHNERLAYRMAANEGLGLVPVRIEENRIKILLGANPKLPKSQNGRIQPAAWLQRYDRFTGKIANWASKYPNNRLPQHRDHISMWLECIRRGQFFYWRVRNPVPYGQALGSQPEPSKPTGQHIPTGEMIKAEGYVCITGRNIDRKHDERVFFSQDEPFYAELTEELRKQWKELIRNYQSIHQSEIESGQSGPPTLPNSQWSRQVIGGSAETELATGTLCYASVRKENGIYGVEKLFPVMISRALHEVNPESLLDDSLKPAQSLEELSPADRVFGWVKQKGKGSYRGNVRISQIRCITENASESFDAPGVPLAILGQPKPQQARFYVARDKEGRQLQENSPPREGYSKSGQKALRGRKVYPHHAHLADNYWQNPTEDRTQSELQEYRRPNNGDKTRDSQNRSILGWVRPGTEFKFTIDISNLSEVELGALLWLLDLPQDHFHRLGGGKPLGFGSVKLTVDWDATSMRSGEQWQQIYRELAPLPEPENHEARECIKKFQLAVADVYRNGSNFESVRFIAAFIRCVRGFAKGTPIHYPRRRRLAIPEGKSFEWFGENEKQSKASLPDLSEGQSLPGYYE